MSEFERRIVRNGSRMQIWERRGGRDWELLVDRDEHRDQYGPYAW